MTSSARRRNDSTDPLVSAVVHFAELNEIMAACAADAARACDPAQRSTSATQHIIDGAIDGLGLAQRNHSPRAGMSVFSSSAGTAYRLAKTATNSIINKLL